MTIAPIKPITLEEFLELPETKPALELINGQISQKPMPDGKHSLLQVELFQTINQITKPLKIAKALPELLCIVVDAAIVPDVSVFRWERIPRHSSGRIANRFEIHPDWAIEILSPEQKYKKVLANLLHCAEHGTELGWLLDPEDESVLVVFGDFVPNAFGRRVQEFKNEDSLPIPKDIPLELTARQVFSWLSL
jgi:Uma2 family endonuclease